MNRRPALHRLKTDSANGRLCLPGAAYIEKESQQFFNAALVSSDKACAKLFKDFARTIGYVNLLGPFPASLAGIIRAQSCSVDAVVIDISAARKAIPLTREMISGFGAGTRTVLIIGSANDLAAIRQSFPPGLAAIIQRPCSRETFFAALQAAARNDFLLSGALRDYLLATESIAEPMNTPIRLTTREWEVLHLQRIGKSYKEIASILNLSQNTVNNHLARIRDKLDAHNCMEAVNKAFGQRLRPMKNLELMES
jgi:DNA-binding NarL/FixJ family response regulator